MPKLIALERFYYGGRNVEMDEQFVADEIDVDLLTHAVKPMAKLPDRGEPEPEPEPPPEPEVEAAATATKSARHRRRDMRAED
jgi:hypothetical protein